MPIVDQSKPPTCATCPYWLAGRCRVNPPSLPRTEANARSVPTLMGIFPGTEPDDVCGSHPDFLAYLKARADQRSSL